MISQISSLNSKTMKNLYKTVYALKPLQIKHMFHVTAKLQKVKTKQAYHLQNLPLEAKNIIAFTELWSSISHWTLQKSISYQ